MGRRNRVGRRFQSIAGVDIFTMQIRSAGIKDEYVWVAVIADAKWF